MKCWQKQFQASTQLRVAPVFLEGLALSSLPGLFLTMISIKLLFELHRWDVSDRSSSANLSEAFAAMNGRELSAHIRATP